MNANELKEEARNLRERADAIESKNPAEAGELAIRAEILEAQAARIDAEEK